MIQIFLVLLVICSVLVLAESNIIKMLLYLGVFSLVSSVCFLLFAAPDVAIAEAVVSAFSTIIFVVAFEKYYKLSEPSAAEKKSLNLKKYIAPAVFTVFLAVLFISFIPAQSANTSLKERYTALFSHDVGGENAVTAIYLGYRMYDTLFEALMLFVSVIAIVHLSWYEDTSVSHTERSDIIKSDIAYNTIRIISPLLILFGIYLVMNGHLSPGGGFQGGVMAAAFFAGRYVIYDIYDIPIIRVINMEKLIYVGIVLLFLLFIFSGAHARVPALKSVYLIFMNTLIGMKVACGFLIIFYRFIALERR